MGDEYTLTTVTRYDPETNITAGYILSGTLSEIYRSLLGIPEQFATCDHPLLTPILMVEQTLETFAAAIEEVNGSLYLVEHSTGLEFYRELKNGPNYQEAAQLLNFECRRFAYLRTVLLTVELKHTFLAEQLEYFNSLTSHPRYQELKSKTAALSQRLAYSQSNIEHFKVYKGLEMRYQAQQILVSSIFLSLQRVLLICMKLFNLIAQEDNKVNIDLTREMRQIARKTKEDGSTMKLIAVLGTVFLPATFVSVSKHIPAKFQFLMPNRQFLQCHYSIGTPQPQVKS